MLQGLGYPSWSMLRGVSDWGSRQSWQGPAIKVGKCQVGAGSISFQGLQPAITAYWQPLEYEIAFIVRGSMRTELLAKALWIEDCPTCKMTPHQSEPSYADEPGLVLKAIAVATAPFGRSLLRLILLTQPTELSSNEWKTSSEGC